MKIIKTNLKILIFYSLSSFVYGQPIGQLPLAISNNAVAAANTTQGWQLFSFNGLEKDKDWKAVSNKAIGFDIKTKKSFTIGSVPYKKGRLASTAVTLKNKIYLFGGYTVEKNHTEKSMSDVYQFDPETKQFSLFSQMPISVDDSVALVYEERYIYLISGWHNVGNVTDVQVLDTQTKQWFFATPYPGQAVFGHSAGIVDNKLVVVDGVKVTGIKNNKRQYAMSPVSYLGTIDKNDFSKIHWQKLPTHPGKSKYRMAAVGLTKENKVIFAGGSNNPYNYSGVGYNKVPSEPNKQVFCWDFSVNQWKQLPSLKTASMDHRGLVNANGQLYILGGMLSKQIISDKVSQYHYKK